MRLSNGSGRNISGIILLDKPCGLLSTDLLQKVKSLFYANKAGHTGTLDQLATGMLPVCLGEATKFSQYLLNADKRYWVTARLGERTDTSDSNGQTISIRPVLLDQARLESALNYFRGVSSQVPSMFSALKYHGHPLYKYARKGVTVKRNSRLIHVYNLQLCYWDSMELKLEIHCSKGTYIRTIIDDLGELLGCGAHVTVLRRLAIAHYPPERMITLSALQDITNGAPKTAETLARLDRLLLPIDSILANIPVINLSSEFVTRVRFGQAVKITTLPQDDGLVRLTERSTGRFFGIGKINALGRLIPLRLMSESSI